MRRQFKVEEVKKAVEVLGGRVAMSRALNVSYQTISDWVNDKKTPSLDNCIRIESATEGKIKARDILPPSSYDPWENINKEEFK